MGSVPVLKAREVIARLERLGFVEVRQRGSHKQFLALSAALIQPIARVRYLRLHSGRRQYN